MRGKFGRSMFPIFTAIAVTVWHTYVLCMDVVDGAQVLDRSKQLVVPHTCRTNVVTRVGTHFEAIRRTQENKPTMPIDATLLLADQVDFASIAMLMKCEHILPSICPCAAEVQQVGNPASA